MSYMRKILAGAVILAIVAFFAVWYLTSSAYAGHSPGGGTRFALGVLCSGGGFVTGALCAAVFFEPEEHADGAADGSGAPSAR